MPDPSVVAPPVVDSSTMTGEELLGALRGHSCVLLSGLEWLPATVAAMMETSAAFFDLPEDEKAHVRWSGEGPWAGWQPLYAAGADQRLGLERYELSLPDPAGFASDQSWAANFTQWPQSLPSMPTAWAAYYRRMRELSNRLVQLLAEALGLPDDQVEAWTDGQHANLCVNHYLAQSGAPGPEQIRQRPHTDLGGLTLLWTDGTPGLEAAIGPDDAWVPVGVPTDCVLLQAGDLLHLWSGGVIPANKHRVVSPERDERGVGPERYSVVYFHHPDLEAWVAPAVVGEAAAPGVRAREHVMARQAGSYTLG